MAQLTPTSAAAYPPLYDFLVIGEGVVGLSILRSAAPSGLRCALVEAAPHILSGASSRNPGIACTGVDASPGTLERRLIRESIGEETMGAFFRDMNLPAMPRGSLVCIWDRDGPKGGDRDGGGDGADSTSEIFRLEAVARESWEAGDSASIMTADEVAELEPSLSPSCRGAVHIEGETVVDPWLFPVALACHARENGGIIYTDWPFDPEGSKFDGGTWTVTRGAGGSGCGPRGRDDVAPPTIRARAVVNAVGIDADLVQSRTP